ncbi:MAG: hypothetical protein JW850_22930 [Thermoflexales bacterium]|nr:hypothetical protein [Thermoflexales bacterium]
MSAKINLIGQPQELRVKDNIVTFKIVAGPASNSAPKGLPMFKPSTYVVQCTERQFKRARVDESDDSELVIEGYLEPRLDGNGKACIAVVGTSITSKRAQTERKLEQIRAEAIKAEEAYEAACDQYGEESPQAKAALDLFEKVKSNLVKYLSSHPEIK